MRRRIFEIIERSDGSDRASSIYDGVMLFLILISLVPLAFKGEPIVLRCFDRACAVAFAIDYVLRLCTADYKYGRSGIVPFLRYPFSFMAIVDLVSILPSLTALNKGFKVLRVLRMGRALRVFRVFKALRYSRSVEIILGVFRRSKQSLIAVGSLAVGYILVSALVVFNVEPDSYNSFFDAVYWATVSLTTVGYGDIYPVTTIGRIVTMISSMFGIAVVAMPAGIITAGYMDELREQRKDEEDA